MVSSLLSMEIRDAEGRSYDVDLSAVTAADSPSPDGEIAQGDTIRGEVGFLLPVSATGLTWRFSGNLFQLGQAVFSLGNVDVPVSSSGSTLDESPTTTPTPTVSQTPLPTPTRASTPTPTREPTRTPEPTPVAIGTTVAAGGSSYTLNEVKDPAPAGIFGVAEGKRLIALDITQVGFSDDGDPFNALYFAVQDSDGYVYSPGLADADVEPQFGSGELAAGQIVRGWVVFELPESARLMSVMVEAEVFGSRTTIADLSNPIPRNGATTPTPIAEAEVISTMQMKVTDSSGNHISTMEQWRP